MLNSALCYWNLRLQPMRVIPACGIFHISWSWRVGLFPWHFAVCSLHFAQQFIQFLPLPVGFVLLPHLGWGSGKLLWLTLCSVSWGEMESVTSKELTQSPNDKSFWLSGLVLCYFSFLEGNCVVLQQCWLIFLIQKSESRKKLKTGENFMSQVCSCCFNHCL